MGTTSLFSANSTRCGSSIIVTSKKKHPSGAIAGGTVAGVIVFACLLYILCRCKKRARKANNVATQELGEKYSRRFLDKPELWATQTADVARDRTKMPVVAVPTLLPSQGKKEAELQPIQADADPSDQSPTTHAVKDSSSQQRRLVYESNTDDRTSNVVHPSEVDHTHVDEAVPDGRSFVLEMTEVAPPAHENTGVRESQMYIEDVAHPSDAYFSSNVLDQALDDLTMPDGGPELEAPEADADYGMVISIDLGTTYSRVGVLRDGQVEIIAHDIPSWISFKDHELLIGDSAKNAFCSNPENVVGVFDIKRFIGRKMDDQYVVEDMKRWPFKLKEKNGRPAVLASYKCKEQYFYAEELYAMILRKMKETAEAYLGQEITHAVMTVPACFNDIQRQATIDAGTIAGLKIIRLINDPTAAAIAYGLNKKTGKSKIIVYDMGGGSFDASLLSIADGEFKVLATAGFSHLGGEDFDNRVLDYLINAHQKKTGRDLTTNLRVLTALKLEVEKAKRTLSDQQSTQIKIDDFNQAGGFAETLTRAKFEELNMELFRKTMGPVQQILKDANIQKEVVDEVILIGGSTYIPKIQELLKYYFDKENKVLGTTSIGAEGDVSGEPTSKIKQFHPDAIEAEKSSKSISSVDAVVYGAAVKGGTLSSSQHSADVIVPMVDVSSHSLGIELVGGVFARLIPRNTIIPTTNSDLFTTYWDNQTVVRIAVFEGESKLTRYNCLLGQFDLSDIRPAPRGVPQIEVTFAMNMNGITKVTAVNKENGGSESITVTAETSRMSGEEIDRAAARMRKGYLSTN